MLPSAVQILAFALALLGLLGAMVATLLPNWTVSAAAWSGPVAAAWRMRGLWMDCVCFGSGVFSCTMKASLLSLPPHMQATRAAMVLSCMVAAFGLCLAALGLKCTRWGGGWQAKGRTAVAAGGCFILASFLCLAPASWFTSEVVAAFLTSDLPDSRKFQPGGALCLTFLSAGFLLAGGVIFCLSCPGTGTGHPDSPSPVDPDRFIIRRQEAPGARHDPSEAALQQKLKQHVQASPSKFPQKDLKDNYVLQEYV